MSPITRSQVEKRVQELGTSKEELMYYLGLVPLLPSQAIPSTWGCPTCGCQLLLCLPDPDKKSGSRKRKRCSTQVTQSMKKVMC